MIRITARPAATASGRSPERVGAVSEHWGKWAFVSGICCSALLRIRSDVLVCAVFAGLRPLCC